MDINGIILSENKNLKKYILYATIYKIYENISVHCKSEVIFMSDETFPHVWGGIIPEGDGHHSATRIPVNFCFFPLCLGICCFQDYLPLLFTQRAQYLIFLTESEKNKPTSFPKEQPLHPSLVG